VVVVGKIITMVLKAEYLKSCYRPTRPGNSGVGSKGHFQLVLNPKVDMQKKTSQGWITSQIWLKQRLIKFQCHPPILIYSKKSNFRKKKIKKIKCIN